MKIAVISPHRDDAAFSLSLAVGAWLAQGHAVEVINVFTRSEYAPYSDVDSLHANDRLSFASAVRKREDEAWVKMYVGQLGRGRLALTDLNLKDAPLRLHCTLEEVQQRQPELSTKVSQKLKGALVGSGADAYVLPLGIGADVDHLTAREGALPADAANTPLAFYEDLPYAAEAPETIDMAVQAAALQAGIPLQPVFAEAAGAEKAIDRKRRMALCYDSQLEDAVADRIAAFSLTYAGRERLWANAAWLATDLSVLA